LLDFSSQQVDETRGRSSMDGVTDATHGMGNLSTAADPKQQQPSAFQIAVSVAHAAEHKVRTVQAPLCALYLIGILAAWRLRVT
jgi:hypothetical protein